LRLRVWNRDVSLKKGTDLLLISRLLIATAA